MKKKTQTFMDILDPGFDDSETEIHEKISSSDVSTQKRDLQNYFDATLGATAFGLAYFDNTNNPTHYQSIMRCRYKVTESPSSSAWNVWSWTGKNEITVDQETNTIAFECWSSIGRIYSGNFVLVLHSSKDLDVCRDFIEDSFYQSVTLPSESNGPSEFCNVPGSDFAELTFHFNSGVGRKLGSTNIFWDITCEARLNHGQGSSLNFTGDPAYLIKNQGPRSDLVAGQKEPITEIFKRFAVPLQTVPTTADRTRVRFDCRIRFKDQITGKLKDNNCRHSVSFRDCDKPVMNPKEDCEDQKACFSSCGAQHKPYQYCGPHQLTYEIQRKKTVMQNANNEQCCSTGDCIKHYKGPFSCQRLGPDDDLQRCEPKPTWSSLMEGSMTETTKSMKIMIGIIMGVLALATVGLRKWRRSKQDNYSDDFGYQTLL